MPIIIMIIRHLGPVRVRRSNYPLLLFTASQPQLPPHPPPKRAKSARRLVHVRGQSVLPEGGSALVAELSVDGDAVAAHAVDVVVHGQFGRGGFGHVDEAAELAGEGLGLEADVHVVLHALSASLLHDVACHKAARRGQGSKHVGLGSRISGRVNEYRAWLLYT